ncbi:hypothetical protein THAOC_37476 [Thalassiosira oceanica]|uniref:Uncharacterized protein n=1 Tax=Thalassiosira oceanica TaxID=159749 RepID=K0RBU6_THAOC|nr:hypothetical protein THAOC_37476 [Thalassiosira oceanica]|eukprot:EJK44022.1 hypothetical protein THAOC_37476 [Thalassiosira oceanica]
MDSLSGGLPDELPLLEIFWCFPSCHLLLLAVCVDGRRDESGWRHRGTGGWLDNTKLTIGLHFNVREDRRQATQATPAPTAWWLRLVRRVATVARGATSSFAGGGGGAPLAVESRRPMPTVDPVRPRAYGTTRVMTVRRRPPPEVRRGILLRKFNDGGTAGWEGRVEEEGARASS